MNAWAERGERTVDASERGGSGSGGSTERVHKEGSSNEVWSNLSSRKTAGTDQIANGFMKSGGEEIVTP